MTPKQYRLLKKKLDAIHKLLESQQTVKRKVRRPHKVPTLDLWDFDEDSQTYQIVVDKLELNVVKYGSGWIWEVFRVKPRELLGQSFKLVDDPHVARHYAKRFFNSQNG